VLFSVEGTLILSVEGALHFGRIVDRDVLFNPKSSALLSEVAKARGEDLLAPVHVMRVQLVTVAFSAFSLGFTFFFAVDKRAIINLEKHFIQIIGHDQREGQCYEFFFSKISYHLTAALY
jgi:hypothetical protein